MASGVNVKMGVTGVAQFKQQINTAKSSLKTLDAQLALNEKQFKATGDAESYMTERSELLKAKLEQQKAVVANTEKALEQMRSNGVERSSKAYQDMYQQMLKAKGEMLDTQSAMEGVAEAGEEAANGVDDMNQQLKRVGDGINFQNVTQSLNKITSGMERAAQRAVQLGKKIVSAMLGAGSYADELTATASAYGLTPEQLQRMEKTSTIIDTSVESIISAQKKLKKGLGSADQGVMGAFVELLGEGYDPGSRGWENAFWDAGEALTKFTDEEEREVYAQKLFGKSWNDLMPLFEAGRKEYEETNASWKVLSDEQIESLGKMDDEYQKLQQTVETLKLEILSNFAEPMAKVLETITGKLGEFTDWLESEEGKQYVDNVVMVVKGALEWITDEGNINTVIGALGTIVGGWGLLKLTGGALEVLQMINGINGLRAGGAAASAASAGAAAGSSWASAFASAAMKAAPFLAFLYTLLNPSAGSDALGSNDLVDANGQLTKEAQAYGYQLDENGQAYLPETPEWMRKYQEEAVKKKLESTYVGDTEAATERNQHWLNNNRTLEDLQSAADKMERTAEELSGGTDKQKQSSSEMTTAAGTLKGMPGQVEAAIIRGMSQIKIVIDGQQMSNAIEPHMSSSMGGRVYMLTK